MKQITWSSKLVQVSKIKPTPTNYKIKTDLGKERLALSLKKFGLAGTVVLNTDFTLIDGNSRLEEAKKEKQKTIWASFPNFTNYLLLTNYKDALPITNDDRRFCVMYGRIQNESELFDYLVCEREQRILIDWLAYVVQNAGKRINWAMVAPLFFNLNH